MASKKSRMTLAAFAAMSIAAPIGAEAGVMSIPDRTTLSPDSPLEQVHYRYYHRHYYRHAHYYPRHWRHVRYHRHYYGYAYPYYNPAGALAGAAVGLATAPAWALFGGPYWW